MNCKKAEDIILTDYVDGKLAGEDLRKLEEHLALCEKCRALAREAASAGKAFKAFQKESPPAGVWHKIKAEIGPGRSHGAALGGILDSTRYFFTHLKPAIAITAAAALILLVLTTARLVPTRSAASNGAVQDDILTRASFDKGWDEPGYDFGTSAEEYFL